MRGGGSFFLVLATIILIFIGSLEFIKWVQKSGLKSQPAGTVVTSPTPQNTSGQAPLAVKSTVESNSGNSSATDIVQKEISKDSSKKVIEGPNDFSNLWIQFETDLESSTAMDPAESKKFVQLLQSALSKQQGESMDPDTKRRKVLLRFVSKGSTEESQVGPIGYGVSIELLPRQFDKWDMKFRFQDMHGSDRRVLLSSQRQFPLSNPLPNHSMMISSEGLVAQMSGFLASQIQDYFQTKEVREKIFSTR